ncbi:MAG: permease, partial [Bacteroidota bacterium]
PATIFIALLKIKIEPALLFLPFMALAINFAMFFGTKAFLKLCGYQRDSATHRTLLMLIPSFAPGLSCLPFVLEYLGDTALAHAALADVGNKVFVLIILYLLAMHWYYQLRPQDDSPNTSSRVKELLSALIKEPINMVIVVAILLLVAGFNLASLPTFLQDSITRMSALMTPMVLIFIGIAVKLSKREFVPLLQLLFLRSGLAFLLSTLLLFLVPGELAVSSALLIVAFPQSACSFWPFAHMTAVNTMEEDSGRTFDVSLALNVLALSLPFSTSIILGVFSAGEFFASPLVTLLAGLLLMGLGALPRLLRRPATTSTVVQESTPVQQNVNVAEMSKA